jgi:hypothetical protein
MHNYLDKLESRIGSTKAGKILFNKHYGLKDLYWTLFYAVSISLLAGIGNGISELGSGVNSAAYFVVQGFINNLYFSFFVNIFYAKIVDRLSHGRHFRRNGNILWAIVAVLSVTWHYIMGTENPIQTNILPNLTALIVTNHHINVLSRKISKI